jgi:tubulin gamma
VSGVMLANHTSIQSLFQRIVVQYDKLRNKGAFLDGYKREAMFSDSLEEFDDSREVADELIKEYKACETPEYGNFGSEMSNKTEA